MKKLGLAVIVVLAALTFQSVYDFSFEQVTPARATPTLSGATTTEVVNGDFSGEGLGEVGTPPTNHDFEASAQDVGTPASNHDFEDGDFTDWTTTGDPAVNSGRPDGYYASMDSGDILLSAAFTVDDDAQVFKVDLAPATTGFTAIYFNVKYGATYSSTRTNYITVCSSCTTTWRELTIDAAEFKGDSVKIEFKRQVGDIDIDNVAVMEETVQDWTPADGTDVAVMSGGPDGNYIEANDDITSPAFNVDDDAQNGEVQLKVASGTGTYKIYVLSGAGYSTSTQVASGTQADSSWGARTFGLGPWVGESIKIKIDTPVTMTVNVDDAGVSQHVLPGWTGSRRPGERHE